MKLFFDSGDHLVERGEVPIMSAEPACEFPCAFDGVQFRTVWRKEDEREIFLTQLPPFLVQFGVMKTGIVENDDNLPMRTNGSAPELFEKYRKCLSIECFHFPAPDKLAIA